MKTKNLNKAGSNFFFSLRGRLVLSLAFVVIFVSSTIVYISADMIYRDKRAYLYDNANKSLQNAHSSMQRFFESKIQLARASKLYSEDKDLYQIKTLTPEGENKFSEELVYTSQEYANRYKKKNHLLEVSYAELEYYFEVAKVKGFSAVVHHEKGRNPRFIVLVYDKDANKFLFADYGLDFILESLFGDFGYNITMFSGKGEPLYSNKPFNDKKQEIQFLGSFVTKLKPSLVSNQIDGVKELQMGDKDYIVTFKKIEKYGHNFLISTIKTEDAYIVTQEMVLTTVSLAFGMVGVFILFSLILARSITNPLVKFSHVTNTIADGNFSSRVDSLGIAEIDALGDSFNKMVEKILEYNDKLKEYNRTLEAKVEERTKELQKANNFIKATIDSISQGLLVFNNQGKALGTYTRACESLLGTRPAEKEVYKLINYEDKNVFKEWVQTLFDEPIPFDSLIEMGPTSIPSKVDYSHDKFKHITLEFYPMRDESEKVENIVMLATDKTREFKAAKEIEEQQNYIKMISSVLKEKANFLRFSSQFISSITKEIADIESGVRTDNANLMRVVHSMKGTAAFFNIKHMVGLLHDFETDLTQKQISIEEVHARIAPIFEAFEISMNKIKEFVGEIAEKANIVEIDEAILTAFYEKTRSEEFYNEFLTVPVVSYIEQYKSLVANLSVKLEKKVKPIVVLGGDLRVDKHHFQAFFDSCIHLFRNCVDHGIEKPYVRQENGKDEEGTITIEFTEIVQNGDSFLVFSLLDDGKGINPAIIRKKMIELGYPEEQVSESDKEIILHIFDSSFSTAEVLSDISGRGVGLYDIKKNVEAYEGFMEVQSKVGKGTLFTFGLKMKKAAAINAAA